MKTFLVTGSRGFIGRHLVEALRRQPGARVLEFARGDSDDQLARGLAEADVIYHLAAANRPSDPVEFSTVNTGLTERICAELIRGARRPVLVFASSSQAELDNPYGVSKRLAEEAVARWVTASGSNAAIFRLRNVFGKGCRPNYNSVVATFCHNVARGLPIQIHDPAREVSLVYIDDVIAQLLAAQDGVTGLQWREVPVSYTVSLGRIAELIRGFRESRRSLALPSLADEFTRRLYATYLSYLEGADFAYRLDQKSDPRGTLAEFMKQPHFGQIFVSRTRAGVTRGNHYHHTKTEKFLVVEGEAIVRFRPIGGGEIISHRVCGEEFTVVDIPPGYAHSIENVGAGTLVTLFWASEVFDPANPDVYPASVL